jgi:Fe-S cluster assembly protein SufD
MYGAITLEKVQKPHMSTFFDSATTYIESTPTVSQRSTLLDVFRSIGLPTVSDEVWRYAPLSELTLDAFRVPTAPGALVASPLSDQLTKNASYIVRTIDGFASDVASLPSGVTVNVVASGVSLGDRTFIDRYHDDAFALLNGASSPGTLEIRVDPKTHVDEPIYVVHSCSSSSSFPSVHVAVGAGSHIAIIECLVGGEGSLVLPLSEYELADGASLDLATYQQLDSTAWHVARSTALLHRDSRLRQSVIGLGSHYNRSRNDAEFLGFGAENELRTTFLGVGTQVHDFRSHQLHKVGRTHSTLLSKGAVSDHSRSVYTGLIEIENGARRTDARQTNHNLLLSPTAHADTVPNLDIRENDVVCAHASSVGPLDEMQRWYLESRGVPREEAERLMIQGFFNEMTDSLPEQVSHLVELEVGKVLASTHVMAS